jgi:peptidoglycan/xylan/chitin deacetylase (PgdA/CDA1 family)
MRALLRRLDSRVPVDLKRARDRSVAGAREGIAALVRTSGLAHGARRLRAERRAGILLYHNPSPEALERHLEYLSSRHTFVGYGDVARAVRSGDWSDLPPKCLAVTFDDGHAGNAALVPVLRRFGIVPTVFLCTAIVGTHRRFWWTLEQLTGAERDRMMDVGDAERLAELRERHDWWPTREEAGDPPQALSLEQVRALLPDVDFQAHTRSHPILPACTEPAAWDEISSSRSDVEALTGRACRHFAYPNGRYGERELELVRRAGYESARTVEPGWNDPATDPYRLRVLGITDDASLGLLAAQVTGLPGLRRLMYMT